ncbi:uncharacterized protein FFB20_11652 [Fusarium fujikuroi]|nr:uncharacterized protein FFB20_11652 [Fusarium fujikuroi]
MPMHSPALTPQTTITLHHHNPQLQALSLNPSPIRTPHQLKFKALGDAVAGLSHVLNVALTPPIVNTT